MMKVAPIEDLSNDGLPFAIPIPQAMIFIPLPFVVALLLLILFVIVLRRDEEGQPNWPFLTLLLLSALQSVLSGLRWGYGVHAVGVIAPVTNAKGPNHPSRNLKVRYAFVEDPNLFVSKSLFHQVELQLSGCLANPAPLPVE